MAPGKAVRLLFSSERRPLSAISFCLSFVLLVPGLTRDWSVSVRKQGLASKLRRANGAR